MTVHTIPKPVPSKKNKLKVVIIIAVLLAIIKYIKMMKKK